MSRDSDLYAALQEAREVIEEQNEELERIAQQSSLSGTVLQIADNEIIVAVAGQGTRVMPLPPQTGKHKIPLIVGDPVVLAPDSFQITRKGLDLAIGESASITRIIEAGMLEVNVKGTSLITLCSDKLQSVLKVGDNILLDASKSIVVTKLDTPPSVYQRTDDTGVVWDDIGGQEEAKQYLIEAIEMPMKYPEVFAFYNKKPIKGVLLEGPPGCGKTMLAKAAASSVGGMDSLFLYVKGPEILDPYVGVAEATLRSLFQQARQHKMDTGMSAVIFIDEAEALLGARGSHNSHMEKTLVPTFLAEMDGLDDSGAVVILATNNASTLDPAVTREGRMDRKVSVRRPNQSEAETIFRLNLQKAPLAKGAKLDDIVAQVSTALFDPSRKLYEGYFDDGTYDHFTFANLASGALIAGIIDQATSAALRRDIHSGKKPGGVGLDDVLVALEGVFQQNLNVNHDQPLKEFAGSRNLIQIKRI